MKHICYCFPGFSNFLLGLLDPARSPAMKNRLSALLSAALLLAGALPVQARTVSWSSAVFDELYNSQGAYLDSTFSFEIGMFINGFNPTAGNTSDWSANWIVFDRAFYDTNLGDPTEAGWNVGTRYFAGSAVHQTNGTSNSPDATPGGVFPQNAQAYLWVYNSKDITFTSEWALVTDLSPVGNTGDSWLYPNPADQISPTLTWSLADADTAIFGAVGSGSSTGAGNVSSQPSNYSLQTYQVPEPGSVMLVASAGLLLMLRRSRFLRLHA